ncbi:MAG: hypothetical protein K0S63_1212, partial [Gammaproteobacteria bacterium]|nr:hypothetical protein [Gammaproteobacteria bacterium]
MALTRPPLLSMPYNLLINIFSHVGLKSLLQLSGTNKAFRDFILGKSEIYEVNKESETLWKERLQRHYFPSIVKRMFPTDGSMPHREIFSKCYEEDYSSKKQLLTLVEEDDSKSTQNLFLEKGWFLPVRRDERAKIFPQFEEILTRKQWFLDFCFEQAATRYNFPDKLIDISSLDEDAADQLLGYLILCNQPWKMIQRVLDHRATYFSDDINAVIRCTADDSRFDFYLKTPLALAATCGFYHLVEQLLRVPNIGYDWNTVSNAAERGHLEVVKLLTQQHIGFDRSITHKILNPLLSVAYYGYIDVLEYLLKLNELDVDFCSVPSTSRLFIDFSALGTAMSLEYPLIAQALLRHPRSPDRQYEIIVRAACYAIRAGLQFAKWIFEMLPQEEIFQGIIFNEVDGLAQVIDEHHANWLFRGHCNKLKWLREQLIERGSKLFFSIYNNPRSNRYVKEYFLLAMGIDINNSFESLETLDWNLISAIFEQPTNYDEFKPQLQLASALFQRPFMK